MEPKVDPDSQPKELPPDIRGMDSKTAKRVISSKVHDLEKELNSKEKVCKLRTNFNDDMVVVWYRPFGSDENLIGATVDINSFLNDPHESQGEILRQIQARMKSMMKPSPDDMKE